MVQGGSSGAVLATQSQEAGAGPTENAEERQEPHSGNGLLHRSIFEALGDGSQAAHPEIAPR